MAKNHYLVLGVPTDARLEHIKAAYRQRALELHPDRTGSESGPFREVQEAYEVLSDPARREAYDVQLGKVVRVDRRWGHPRAEPLRAPKARPRPTADPSTIPPQAHVPPSGAGRPWTTFARTIDVPLSRAQAEGGGQVRLRIPWEEPCSACRGAGRYGFYRCGQCGGTGRLVEEISVMTVFPAGILSTWTTRIAVHLLSGRAAELLLRFYVR